MLIFKERLVYDIKSKIQELEFNLLRLISRTFLIIKSRHNEKKN